LLTKHGCPATRRLSAMTMARIAYGVGLAAVSWAGALVFELTAEEIRARASESDRFLVRHAGAILLAVLPIVVSAVVFGAKRRHRAALAFTPVAFAFALTTHFWLYAQFGGPY